MPSRFVLIGDTPDAVSRAAGFCVDDQTYQLTLNRGIAGAGALTSDPGDEVVPVARVIATTANVTLTKADSGAIVLCSGTTITVTLPATAKGLVYTVAAATVASGGVGHSVSPAAADQLIGNGFSPADNKDAILSAATDRAGDCITVVGDGNLGWYITSVVGTWALES